MATATTRSTPQTLFTRSPQTVDTATLVNCQTPGCARMLKPGDAAVCRRALRGQVRCCVCRMRLFPEFDPIDQPPPGCRYKAGCTGYGEWTATLTTQDGREFYGAGRSDQLALSNARAQARRDGALPEGW